MRIELTPAEARVIGCLIEKETVTPAQYPLSLSALTSACNQKSSRDPVMDLSDAEVQQILDGLLKRHLVSDRGGFGSRVTKYQHRFANVGFGSLEFTEQEMGVICVLLLRGPQTAGELRSRTGRLCRFEDAHEVESVLQTLIDRDDGPFVARLARDPGARESRYMHLFGGEAIESVEPVPASAPASGSRSGASDNRLAELEELVLEMQQQLEDLGERLAKLESRGGD